MPRIRAFASVRLVLVALAIAVLGVAGCTPILTVPTSKTHHHANARHHAKATSRHKKTQHKRRGRNRRHAHHKARHHGHRPVRHPRRHHVHHAKTPRDTLVIEPSGGFSSVYRLINSAKHSIEVTMFELADTTAEHDLAAAAKRGVAVRVILDRRETSINSGAMDYLSSHGVEVVWSSPDYTYTHQKTLVFDHSVASVESANLTSRYYPSSRDFLVLDTNQADISAIIRVFNADFAHKPVKPADGADLVWSPTDSETHLLALINGAKENLRIYSEEMGDSTVIDALIAAARRGVNVSVCGENSDSEYTETFDRMARDGVHISYFSSSTGFYIHGKVVMADYGTSRARVFIGSENFSNTSLNQNRELGLITTSPAIMTAIAHTFAADFAKGHQVK
ncbi:MAG TPA: phospholipase D-like domain-containing protein [Streptosporangiaceae bacterium]|nr:phospholipase D-like domain-containing protein [Streptosporangiaceae bacterium]